MRVLFYRKCANKTDKQHTNSLFIKQLAGFLNPALGVVAIRKEAGWNYNCAQPCSLPARQFRFYNLPEDECNSAWV